MAYHEEEQLKLKRINTKQAIALAMQGKWQEAIVTNKNIIEIFPDDVDAYNRLGRAYMETGEYRQAQKAYEHSLNLDAYNAIAKKNLQRLTQLKEITKNPKQHVHTVQPHFIEEAGKSGVLSLQRLASAKTLAGLVAGDVVILKVDITNLVIKTTTGEYIGTVEPKHAQRLIKLIKGGNKYSAAIISSDVSKVTVIVRETYTHPSLVGQPSFPPRWVESARTTERAVEQWEEDEEEEEEPGYTDEEPEPILPEDYSPTDELGSEE
ncbi:MAG: tetratricopeptide repeat protein [Dehalococcoidales bacterium]|nr:tetratricopeptide repeat protein [Dehalococcoidales bacterium]